MKKILFIFLPLITIVAIIAFSATSGQQMYVQMKSGELKGTPSYGGAFVTEVKFGQALTVAETKGAWTKVSTADGKSGWIHSSIVTKENIPLKTGAKDAQTGASVAEGVAATKGFTKQIEDNYRKAHKDIDYSWIDKMEKISIPPKERDAFIKEGKLTPATGGAE